MEDENIDEFMHIEKNKKIESFITSLKRTENEYAKADEELTNKNK